MYVGMQEGVCACAQGVCMCKHVHVMMMDVCNVSTASKYVRMFACKHVCMYVCVYVFMYVCRHVCMC